MAADGLSKSEIARRLGINRRTASKLVEADEPPGYRRAPAGSMLDPLESVLRRLLEEWPEIRAPRVTEVLATTTVTPGRSTLFASGLRRCGQARDGRRSGRATGRGR
jgi:transcriptional regulator with XRE-family HTH domain